MNKQKNSEIKKTLVRNAFEKPHRKSKVIEDPQFSPLAQELKEDTLSKPEILESDKLKKHIKFDTPELQSTLKLSKKIDEVVEPRKTKSCSYIDKKKLAIDEKVTRKVNFPYDQAIYRNLISLTCDGVQSQSVLSSRAPLPQKDKEPVLSDFIEPKNLPDYYHLPSIKLENKMPHFNCNNLRLYKLLEKNNIG